MLCKFEAVRFKNVENGYMVVVYNAKEKIAIKGLPETNTFTAYGYYLPIESPAGIDIELAGTWVQNKKYGYQYEVQSYKYIVEQTERGIKAYLSLLKGIGPTTIEAIFKRFGMQSLQVLEQKPEKLLEVPGIKKGRYEQIIQSYKSLRKDRDLIILLTPHEISPSVVRKISEKLGDDALKKIKENPYLLCGFSGIGFTKADKIALSAGCNMCSYYRILAGIVHVLKLAQSNGHLFLTRDVLVKETYSLLRASAGNELKIEVINTVIQEQLSKGRDSVLHKERTKKYGELIYHCEAYLAEKETAIAIVSMLINTKSMLMPKNINSEIIRAEETFGIKYSEQQRNSIIASFQNVLNVITGYPGTGKTTVIRGIIDIEQRFNSDANIILLSPTGRAARKMMEATGHESSTIHSFLQIRSDNEFERYNTVKIQNATLIIVDELSMMDIYTAAALLNAIPKGVNVVFIGDPEQLPSVGPGAVLNEIIRSKIVPVTVLDKIFRQANTSKIVTNAALIRAGVTELEYDDNFKFIEANTEKEAVNCIKKAYLKEAMLNGCNYEKIQILTPRRNKLDTSSDSLNTVLREIVNKPDPYKPELHTRHCTFRQGDKVLQNKNDKDLGINNGDIGKIETIFNGDDESAIINFEGNKVKCTPDQMKHINWAYAMTVHKSQGSEYDTVIICLMNQHGKSLKRNLIYTAISRGIRKVIIIGQISALKKAINLPDRNTRNTLLADRIVGYMNYYMQKKVSISSKLNNQSNNQMRLKAS